MRLGPSIYPGPTKALAKLRLARGKRGGAGSIELETSNRGVPTFRPQRSSGGSPPAQGARPTAHLVDAFMRASAKENLSELLSKSLRDFSLALLIRHFVSKEALSGNRAARIEI